MAFLRGLWSFVIGVKDALVLLFLLLFFGVLWAVLSVRAPKVTVPDGSALVIPLDGVLVDQATNRNPLEGLFGNPRLAETQARDVLRAIRTAKTDDQVKAIVFDLDKFMGGGRANLQAIGAAIRDFRASGKPVISYATAYTDDGYYIAAHASEAWLNPFGQVLVAGPGGTGLYFKDLLDRLKIDVEVFRVGTYKSFVEPFTRTSASPEAKAADQALANSIWNSYVADVAATRKVDLRTLVAEWPARVEAAGGDGARAALDARLVDKLGSELQIAKSLRDRFGEGEEKDNPSDFNGIAMRDYLSARHVRETGNGVGVVFVTGNIVDGDADAGQAGGDTIARLINEAVARNDVKALVVRVDSPGGSVLASERIRTALLNAKAKGLPIVASFGPVAASGGYWVATAADTIYAQPTTITGSIGVFGILPTFERTLQDWGVSTDTVTTTPLSGQPDLVGGLNAQARTLLQAGVANVYNRFVGLVAQSRKLPVTEVEKVAEGRVWSGSDALRLKLVDRMGDLDTAVRDAAKRAGLPDSARMIPIEATPSPLAQFLSSFDRSEEGADGDAMARLAAASRLRAAAQMSDAMIVARGSSIQAHCFSCAVYAPPRSAGLSETSEVAALIRRLR